MFEGDPLCSCSSFRAHHASARSARGFGSRSRARCVHNSGHQIVVALPNLGKFPRALCREGRNETSSQGPVCVPWRTTVVGVGAPLGMAMRPTIVATVIQGPPESAAMTGRFFWLRFRGVIGSAPTSRLPWKVHLCLWECCQRSPRCCLHHVAPSPRRRLRCVKQLQPPLWVECHSKLFHSAWLSRAFCVVLHVFNAHGILRNPTFMKRFEFDAHVLRLIRVLRTNAEISFHDKTCGRKSVVSSAVVDLITRGF